MTDRDKYSGRFVYHGTRFSAAIQADDRIRVAPTGDTHVSLTRSFDVAVYWAAMDRDDDDGCGCVLILDRAKLEARYSVMPFVSNAWVDCENEHEDAVMSDIHPLSDFLVAVVPVRD